MLTGDEVYNSAQCFYTWQVRLLLLHTLTQNLKRLSL